MKEFHFPIDDRATATILWKISDISIFEECNLTEWQASVKDHFLKYVNPCSKEYTDRDHIYGLEVCANLWFDENYLNSIPTYGIVLLEVVIHKSSEPTVVA